MAAVVPHFSEEEEDFHCGLYLYGLFTNGKYLSETNCILLLTSYMEAKWFFGRDLAAAAADFPLVANGSIDFEVVRNIPHYLYQR